MSQPDMGGMGGGMPNMSQPDVGSVPSPPGNSRRNLIEERTKRELKQYFNGAKLQNRQLRKRRSYPRSYFSNMRLNPTVPGIPGMPGQPDFPSVPKPNNTSNMTESEIPGVEIPAYSVKLLRLF